MKCQREKRRVGVVNSKCGGLAAFVPHGTGTVTFCLQGFQNRRGNRKRKIIIIFLFKLDLFAENDLILCENIFYEKIFRIK